MNLLRSTLILAVAVGLSTEALAQAPEGILDDNVLDFTTPAQIATVREAATAKRFAFRYTCLAPGIRPPKRGSLILAYSKSTGVKFEQHSNMSDPVPFKHTTTEADKEDKTTLKIRAKTIDKYYCVINKR